MFSQDMPNVLLTFQGFCSSFCSARPTQHGSCISDNVTLDQAKAHPMIVGAQALGHMGTGQGLILPLSCTYIRKFILDLHSHLRPGKGMAGA